MYSPYDDVGALGGLFAPAYIAGDPNSMTAVARWNAAHLKRRPAADPWMQSQPVVTNQRDAITQALVNQGATMGQLPGVGGESGSLGAGVDNTSQQGPVTNLGIDPDNPAPPNTSPPDTSPPDTSPPDTSPPNTSPPDTSPPSSAPPNAQAPGFSLGNAPAQTTGMTQATTGPTTTASPGLQGLNSSGLMGTPTVSSGVVGPVSSAFSGVPGAVAAPAPPAAPQAPEAPAVNSPFGPPAVGEKDSPMFGPVAPIGPPAPPDQVATPNVATPQAAAPQATPAQTAAATSALAQGLANPSVSGYGATATNSTPGPNIGLSGLVGSVSDDEAAAQAAQAATFGDPSGVTSDTGLSLSGISPNGFGISGIGFGDDEGSTATNADGTVSGVSVSGVNEGPTGDTATNSDGSISGVSVSGVSEGPEGGTTGGNEGANAGVAGTAGDANGPGPGDGVGGGGIGW